MPYPHKFIYIRVNVLVYVIQIFMFRYLSSKCPIAAGVRNIELQLIL